MSTTTAICIRRGEEGLHVYVETEGRVWEVYGLRQTSSGGTIDRGAHLSDAERVRILRCAHDAILWDETWVHHPRIPSANSRRTTCGTVTDQVTVRRLRLREYRAAWDREILPDCY